MDDGRNVLTGARAAQLRATFARLTDKQHEVLKSVAENRTSKEIAFDLGISESAVNQRIEAIRARSGAPPRAELARAYRQYMAEQEEAYNRLTGKKLQVPDDGTFDEQLLQDERSKPFALADAAIGDALTVQVRAPWQDERYGRLVPEVLDGKNAGLSRTAAIIAISGGFLVVAVVGLSVAQALNGLM